MKKYSVMEVENTLRDIRTFGFMEQNTQTTNIPFRKHSTSMVPTVHMPESF
jgi:hypothetical protein